MSSQQRDRNRFATGSEAASVLERACIEQADVDVAKRRDEHALAALQAAEVLFVETEALYQRHRAARDDAASYAVIARERLEASLERLAEVRAPVHPVRKTPPEVLALIFESCLDYPSQSGNLSFRKEDIVARQLQPARLASVCQCWRRAALDSSRLWSIIELILYDTKRRRRDMWCEYVSTALSRSGSAALHVRVHRQGLASHHDAKLTALLVKKMHRCTSLWIAVNSIEHDDDPVLPILAANTPALRELYMFVGAISAAATGLDLLPAAPALRTVVAEFPFCAADFNLPAVTLGRLRPRCSEARDELAEFLRMAPTVSDLYLRPVISGRWRTQRAFSSVTKLHLTYDQDDRLLARLASGFAFPALKRLHLGGAAGASATRMEYLAAAVGTSPALAYLIVHRLDVPSVDRLLHVLASYSRLERLEIWDTHLTSGSFQTLCEALERENDSGAWLCPALRVVQLGRCTFAAACDQKLLVRCVERRLLAAKDAGNQYRPARLMAVHVRDGLDGAVVHKLNAALAAGA